MGDPSQTVPQDLMPHVHLISSFRYPAMARLDLPEVAKWLMSAPQIARDKAPFFWTYLDKPADSTILLTWQPQGRLGTNFATDGFVWAPPEQIYKHELGPGLLLEIYYLKAGYIPGEQVASHARRRFRLIATQAHPNPASVDSSLFIVHYGPSEPNDRMPATMVPYDERVNTIMQQRHFLLRSGQIRRKEFMLSDRVNWPSLPELTRQQMGPQATPRGVPQQMAYPTSTPTGPPAKRARHGHNQSQAPPGAPPGLDVLDDDEDNSRGDMFDHISPRELSVARYQQNHEWMEEILSSGYRVGQISPSDLGLGLKGELAVLTEGIFTAQGGEALASLPEMSYVGKLDEGQADEFRKRVNDYIESTKSEISKMEKEHAEALAKFKESSLIRIKEKELKSVREETGPEVWRIEGRVDVTDDGESRRLPATKQTIDDIVKDVELDTGKTISGKPSVYRVQAGGFQEPVPEPSPEPEPQPEAAPAATEEGEKRQSRQPSHAGSQNDGLAGGESDLDMGGTAAGLLDQMHSGFSSTSTPNNNFPTPQAQLSAGQSNAATPANVQGQSPAPAAPSAPETTTADVQMGGTEAPAQKQETQPEQEQQTEHLQANQGETTTAPDQGTGSGDWVVVPKESGNESAGEAKPADESAKADAAAGSTTATATGLSAAATPAVTDGGAGGFDQNDFNSLEDLDSAGDALAGFEGSGGDLGEGLDLQMDMEDSAFGDAFHGVGSGTPGGEEQNQDM